MYADASLAMEMADLIRFKTSTLTAIGFQRNGVWGEETASQKIEHLGLMFGALAASPAGIVKGRGGHLNLSAHPRMEKARSGASLPQRSGCLFIS